MHHIKNFIQIFQNFLIDFIKSHTEDNELREILLYATTNGGKRTRPVLCYLFYNILTQNKETNHPTKDILYTALSLELIHCYSLVHDDLPSMDNDDLRRGQPTVHIKYSEASAILAGDALQTMAFSALTSLENSSLSLKTVILLIKTLANASGALGMVNGQFLDMTLLEQADLTIIEKMHAHKTGALLKASCIMGAIAANLTDTTKLFHIETIGNLIGKIFQIQDDILDATQPTDILGKTANKDIVQNKPTFPSVIGLEKAKQEVSQLSQTLFYELKNIDGDTTTLYRFLEEMLKREF